MSITPGDACAGDKANPATGAAVTAAAAVVIVVIYRQNADDVGDNKVTLTFLWLVDIFFVGNLPVRASLISIKRRDWELCRLFYRHSYRVNLICQYDINNDSTPFVPQ
jgi:hypothetical protein